VPADEKAVVRGDHVGELFHRRFEIGRPERSLDQGLLARQRVALFALQRTVWKSCGAQ
jgi:hypothetical protein